MIVSDAQCLGVFQFGLRMFIKMIKVNNFHKGCSTENIDPKILYLRHSCLFTKNTRKHKSIVSLTFMSCEFLIKPQIQCCDERHIIYTHPKHTEHKSKQPCSSQNGTLNT